MVTNILFCVIIFLISSVVLLLLNKIKSLKSEIEILRLENKNLKIVIQRKGGK